ncbi:MAG: hypothetical protein IJO87_02425 [Eggerthellaceae bacterium]|nr:hypothetical protein [Eggerthellaceae bacterium]
MRRIAPPLISTTLLVVTLLASCLLAGCAASQAHPDDGLTLSVEGAAVSLPEGFAEVEPSNFIELPYEDGTISAQMKLAKNAALPAFVTLSKVEGRDFDAVEDWARRLPESAGDRASATSFGLVEDFHGFMAHFSDGFSPANDPASAQWDTPAFYSTSLGEAVRVSYVVGSTRTTTLYTSLGAGTYVEVRATFPNAAYAHDPDYFDGIFSSVREYRESIVIAKASNAWTLVALMFFPVCLVATLFIVLLKKPVRNFIRKRPALEARHQKIKAAGPKEGWSGYVLFAVVMLFLFAGALMIFIGAS